MFLPTASRASRPTQEHGSFTHNGSRTSTTILRECCNGHGVGPREAKRQRPHLVVDPSASIRDGSGSGSGRIPAGFGFYGFGFGDDFSPTVFGFGFGFDIGFGFRFGFLSVDI
jgi:hypothetical protein